MNKKVAFSDFKYACSNCGEKICLNDRVFHDVSLEKAVCFCSEKCRHEWMLKDGSKNDRSSFHEHKYDFFK